MKAAKLIVIYPAPADAAVFERRYAQEHVPIAVEKLIGKVCFDANLITSALGREQEPYHRIAEVYFPSMTALEDCLSSPEGQETAAHADIDSANVETKLKPILHFVKKLTLTPQLIFQTNVKAIFEAERDGRRFLDAIYLCAAVNNMNRLAIGIGIDKGISDSPKLLSVTWPVRINLLH